MASGPCGSGVAVCVPVAVPVFVDDSDRDGDCVGVADADDALVDDADTDGVGDGDGVADGAMFSVTRASNTQSGLVTDSWCTSTAMTLTPLAMEERGSVSRRGTADTTSVDLNVAGVLPLKLPLVMLIRVTSTPLMYATCSKHTRAADVTPTAAGTSTSRARRVTAATAGSDSTHRSVIHQQLEGHVADGTHKGRQVRRCEACAVVRRDELGR
jgi:hypothetical protein